ncbi:glycosyltransferase family A protein [Bradyrhizobium sp. Ec3.3]|uniref:glycosyltransferase family 2 protein n=1 Tax=Bradyrhizobium sp. Ec3.3 TaxID=189753 RepID=UPI000401C3F2|nr:glycosyltransferase family A protein [Bradyrhizobium sp. Ec3.3]
MGASDDLSIVAIIPMYNGATFIKESVASVLAQTLPPSEVLVVDDGSTDNGAAIVASLAMVHPKIRLLRKPNGGQSSARNFGVSHSKSRLIALLDQDDVWHPHHLERLSKPFQKKRGIPLGWVYSNLDEIDESGGMVTKRYLDGVPAQHPKQSIIECLARDMFILPSASLISRRAFEAVGGFDERLSGYEDDDLFLRLFRAGYDHVYLDEPLSKWRIYPGSTSYSPRMARSRMIYAYKLATTFPDNPRQNRYFVRDLIAPRFYANLHGEYVTAVRRGDREAINRVLTDIGAILPHLRKRHALMFRSMGTLLRDPIIGYVGVGIRHCLTGLIRARAS